MLFINVEIFTRSVKNNDKIERLVRGPKEASFKGTDNKKALCKMANLVSMIRKHGL